MPKDNDLQLEVPEIGEEDACPASALQLRLAAAALENLVKQNGGGAGVFWDADAFDSSEDRDEYVDAELWDPDADEILPESEEIEWNLNGCN